jgi:enamine deaminase RidA (YjgF/YER057c/UK114 family)
MAKKKPKAKRSTDKNASAAFAMDQIKPKIEQILAMDLRTERVRQEKAEFVYQTLCEMAAEIEKVCKAAGDYPEGVISGDVWLTGADYASHAQALTQHFAENGWLKHEANASSLWVQATLAVCSHYHDLVGPAMNASADCSRRLGDIDRAVEMWTAVVKDFAFLLDGYDNGPEGTEDEDRVAIESLRESCLALQATGMKTVDSCKLGKLVSKADEILSRCTPADDHE